MPSLKRGDKTLKWLAEEAWRKKLSYQETFLLNFLSKINDPKQSSTKKPNRSYYQSHPPLDQQKPIKSASQISLTRKSCHMALQCTRRIGPQFNPIG
jgi:hypothetical protein